jgi:hypothetical protein
MLDASQCLTSNCTIKAIAIKPAWYRYKNRYEDEWNGIGDPARIFIATPT